MLVLIFGNSRRQAVDMHVAAGKPAHEVERAYAALGVEVEHAWLAPPPPTLAVSNDGGIDEPPARARKAPAKRRGRPRKKAG